ncbi:hypothetical protein D9757_000577 [Collybiopsis confluens]|uniref:C4-dicarboxylate transporter/malic acid transport protein n=1 Tax=Collybiopsis confluens TaxID=2823264 RepID=A0A8H5I1V7_9AGAR|nr:hypothetical protein D9757_000577 [Collybiopsis confluens]
MGTGSISLLFYAFPYKTGSEAFIIWTLIFFFLNLTLFIVFCVITLARYVMFPEIWGTMIRHPSQSLFTGTFPMGATTLLSIAVSLISERFHLGGKPFLYTMWGLWWLDVAISVICCWGMVHIMETAHQHSLESMSAIWILPVVTLIVASSTGGVFAGALNKHNPSYALTTQVVSLVLVTIGLSLAFMLLTIYMQRLIIVGVPRGPNVLSVFMPLGPTGQAAYSILLAGQFFRDVLPLPYGDSIFTRHPLTGDVLYIFSVCVSFVLWCLASMWMLFAVLAVQHELRISRIPFKVNAWGLIFPNGVYANITINLGTTLDSPFFRVWGAIYAVFTLLLWCFVAAKTIQLAYNRTIFEAPCLQEMNLGTAQTTQNHLMVEPKSSSNGSAIPQSPCQRPL